MVKFLISTAFWVAALISGRGLLEGFAYFNLTVNCAALIRVQRVFEAQRLLSKILFDCFFNIIPQLENFFDDSRSRFEFKTQGQKFPLKLLRLAENGTPVRLCF